MFYVLDAHGVDTGRQTPSRDNKPESTPIANATVKKKNLTILWPGF